MRLIVALVTCLLPFSPMSAQSAPELENEWLRVEGLGPVVEGDAFQWTLEITAKVPGLTRILVRDPLEKKGEPLLQVSGGSIYGKILHRGSSLPRDRFGWVFEEGITYRMLELNVYRGTELRQLSIPLSFSEGMKSTLRFLIQGRLGYSEAPHRVEPYQVFDGRLWIQQIPQKIPDGMMVEYVLKEKEEERVLQILRPVTAIAKDVMTGIRESIHQECAKAGWVETSLDEESTFFESSGMGCVPARHVLGILRKTPGGVFEMRYTYSGQKMPEKNHRVWKLLLSHGGLR